MEDQAECLLVLIGATPEGRKELVGFQAGVRESAQSWRELLVEIKRRDLSSPPRIAVGDGALGFWKALDELFPGTHHHRTHPPRTAEFRPRRGKVAAWRSTTTRSTRLFSP